VEARLATHLVKNGLSIAIAVGLTNAGK